MSGIGERLASHILIGLDTAIFIYHLEVHPSYIAFTRELLNGVQSGKWNAVTSIATIMELTVHPRRMNRPGVAREYEAILANFPNLYLADINRDIARKSAALRAIYNIRPVDALQVATALVHQATAWVTNDKKLKQLSSVLDIVILDDLVEF